MTLDVQQRRRLRSPVFLQATILASVDHLGGSGTCNQVADMIGIGLGRTIRACDQLVSTGYLEKTGWDVTLTAKARASLQPEEPEEPEAA